MPNYRTDRIAGDIQRELSDILRELKDPRVTGLLSVVRVEVTNDLSYATIHISAVEGMETAKASVKGLKGAGGFIRSELASRISIRKMPELRFVADDSIAHGAHIAKILKDIDLPDEQDDE